jgi:K+-transporting ATPase ATPase C chain
MNESERPQVHPLRPAIAFLAFMLFWVSLVYPFGLSAVAPYVAELTNPAGPGGSVVAGPNGTSYSTLVGENITCAYFPGNLSSCPFRGLFWSRPSQIDYEPFLGAGGEDPYGPTDPALINQTLYYINVTGVHNVTSACGIPEDIVTDSASGLDPDISPCGALVQIPRIAYYTGEPQSVLTALVDAHIEGSHIPGVGAMYVNVVGLDVALIDLMSTPGTG